TTIAARVKLEFTADEHYILEPPKAGQFDPIDAATDRFIRVVSGRALDGYKILTTQKVPFKLNDLANEIVPLFAALDTWVKETFGLFGDDDPRAWKPSRLEYDLSVK